MEITVTEVKSRLNASEPIHLVDVREIWEFEESKIDQAINIPLHSIPDNLDQFGDKSSETIVYCRTGVRGNTARAVLNQSGFTNIKNMTGGFVAFMED